MDAVDFLRRDDLKPLPVHREESGLGLMGAALNAERLGVTCVGRAANVLVTLTLPISGSLLSGQFLQTQPRRSDKSGRRPTHANTSALTNGSPERSFGESTGSPFNRQVIPTVGSFQNQTALALGIAIVRSLIQNVSQLRQYNKSVRESGWNS
jgi:hypothetical protein